MKIRIQIVMLFILLGLAGCAPASVPESPPIETPIPQITEQPVLTMAMAEAVFMPPEHIIQLRVVDGVGEFFNTQTGERFIPRGVNYIAIVDAGGFLENRVFEAGRYDREVFKAGLSALASRGYNTVRLFIDTCSSGVGCITDQDTGELNGAYLDNLVDAMMVAKETSIFLLLTSNDLPTEGIYWPLSNSQADSDPNFEGYRNAHILTEPGRQSAVLYWTDLMSGLVERRADFDVVLGWSLLNEQWLFGDQPPLNFDEGMLEAGNGGVYDLSDPVQKRALVADNLQLYISEVGAVIREYDPTALVTMGFFAPQFPNQTGIGGSWYVDTAALIEGGAALDFYDFHAYPGDDLTLAQFAENFGMVGHEEIPVIMGEYGAFEHRYDTLEAAARAATQWAADSCSYGWDGWLYWSYFDLPPALGDQTWGFVEQDGFMLDLFAPANQPNICDPVEVPTTNLAYGKPVTTSRNLPEGPGAAVVDENLDTSWQAGADTPQWIRIDLQSAYTITEVRLLVGQWPEGDTVHRIFFRESGTADTNENWRMAHEFSQTTADGDWLVFRPEVRAKNIQYVMVQTVSSPSWVSWREVQVFGEPQE